MSINIAVDLTVEESGKRAPQYTLKTDQSGELSLIEFLQFTRATLITTAWEVLREAQASEGFDKSPIVVVDGKENKPPANVNPLGQIEFVARQDMKDIILDTYSGLIYRSRVKSGDYIRHHYVLHNSKVVAQDESSLKAWLASSPTFEDKDYIVFVNVMPYARKLERDGVTAQRTKQRSTVDKRRKTKTHMGDVNQFVRQPNGTYYLTAKAVRNKYKRNSIIKFTFISGTTLGVAGSFKNGRNGKTRSYLYPAIFISVKENGVL